MNDYDNDDDVSLWQNIETSLLSMNQQEFDVAIGELQELVSSAICDKLDTLEDEMVSLELAKSVLNKF